MAKRARANPTPEFLPPGDVAAWHGVLLLSGRVLRDLDDALREAHGLSVAEFDVLITLYNAPKRRLRMAELARQVALSAAGLTHLVTRLERERLVAREVDPDDGRGVHTVLTDQGLRRLNLARPVHNAVIRRGLLDRITAEDKRRLADICRRALEGDA
jgi:DNA-binding MarR family transcriptional regulator